MTAEAQIGSAAWLAGRNMNPVEARWLHGLKAVLLGALGDKEPSFIARNIFYTGRDRERNQAD